MAEAIAINYGSFVQNRSAFFVVTDEPVQSELMPLTCEDDANHCAFSSPLFFVSLSDLSQITLYLCRLLVSASILTRESQCTSWGRAWPHVWPTWI
jgi:hypothetical protein